MNRPASRLAGVGAGVAVLLLGAGVTSSVAQPWARTQAVDLVASAQPTAADPAVSDDAFHVSSSSWRAVKADTVATSSATCDGCTGEATTLQVLYVRHPRSTHVDNNAVAWAQCQSCSASALSVQVVVVRGGRSLTADNRALAVNGGCVACRSSAAAIQLVVVSPHADRLSPADMDDLRAWVADQDAQLRALPDATPSARAGLAPQSSGPDSAPDSGSDSGRDSGSDSGSALLPGAMDSLQDLVNGSLRSVTDQAHIDVFVPQG